MATKTYIANPIIFFVIIPLLAIVRVSVVSANGGPHDGTIADSTNCALCHRSNTISDVQQMPMQEVTTLCLSCHGTGLGANTNVVDGIYIAGNDNHRYDEGVINTPDGAPLLGGGFVTYLGKPVSSSHGTFNENSSTRGNITAHSINCISCHNPHGSANYRGLREHINGHMVAVAQVDEGLQKDYDTENWGQDVDSLCIACHDGYDSDSNRAIPNRHTHRVGMSYSDGHNKNPETIGYKNYHLPLAESGAGDVVVCMTCHLPHGTSATMSNGNDSNLLRLDNSGVCQVCHQK